MRGLITASEIASTKASGVTTKIVDATRRSPIAPDGIVRLVFGFSSNALVYNRPVFLETGDNNLAERIFGAREKKLERNGSWFHRSLEIALDQGAVLALNLLNTNNETDQNGDPTANADVSDYISFSMSPEDTNGEITSKLYASYFAKDRFWIPDEQYLLATRNSQDSGSLLNFTNTSQRKYSFIVQKADVQGFDVKVKDWYDNEEDIPAFMKPYDLIEDYFVDVIVLSGDYSDYQTLKTDPILGEYFDERGLILDKLDEFLNKSEVSVAQRFQGSIIPNFLDKDGAIKSIDRIINSGINTHGVLCAIDKKELDRFEDGTNTKSLDLVGHSLIDGSVSEIDVLSYSRDVAKELESDYLFETKTQLDDAAWTITYNPKSITVQIPSSVPYFATLDAEITEDVVFAGETTAAGLAAGISYANPILRVSNIVSTATEFTFTLTNDLKQSEISDSFVDLVSRAASTAVASTAQVDLAGAGAAAGGDVYTVEVESDVKKISVAEYVATAGDTEAVIAAGLTAGALGAVTFQIANPSAAILDFEYDGDFQTDFNGSVVRIKKNGAAIATYDDTFTGGNTEVVAGAEYREPTRAARSTTQILEVQEEADLYKLWEAGTLKTGDKFSNSTTEAFVRITPRKNLSTFENILEIEFYSDEELLTQVPAVLTDNDLFLDKGEINVITALPEISQSVVGSRINDNTFRIPFADSEDISIGDYLIGLDADGNKILTRITEMVNVGSPAPTDTDITTEEKISVVEELNGDTSITHYIPFEEAFDRLKVFNVKGLEITEFHKPNGTDARMRDIISVMTDTQMRKALVDPEMITFRYIVDTFNGGIEKNQKNYLTSLAKERRKSLAILNMPSTQEFLDSIDPVFTDPATPQNPVPSLNAKYIGEGGDKSRNPQFLATRPTEEQGAVYGMFFYPNLNELEDDSDVSSVPPAAHVSNNYVVKWETNEGFKAAAGKFRGTINSDRVIGLDHELDKADRGELETRGINPIREKDGTFQIFGNQTAYFKFKSILNQANSIDTLITIETGIEDILDPYTFESVFSDDILRTTIQTSIENYLESIQTLGGIDEFSVKFDRQNNPDFVVEENAAIIDVEVDLPDVTRKFFSRITLVGGTASVSSFAAV